MCDEHTEKDNEAWLKRHPELTRRQFNSLAAASAFSMMLPAVANATEISGRDVEITTPDGIADCYFVHPTEGKHPGVLMWPDIRGLRPAFRAMAERLAKSGYAVLVVNPFYRSTRAPITPGDDFWAYIRPMYDQLTAEANKSDAEAFIAWMDEQKETDTSRKIGTQGYCMGGAIIMRTAAAVPDRVGAAASFHGVALVTDKEDSPHLLIPQMQASVLIATAENDDEKRPGEKYALEEHFTEAGLSAEIEVYDDTMHGWCPPDSSVYHEAQAEKAWGRLLALYEANL